MAIKHFIARAVTENPAYAQAQVIVPAGETLHAGLVVVAEELDAGIMTYGNWDVYTANKVKDAGKEDIAIVLDGGFEQLRDGRRPDGNPDYTQYIFNEGDVVTSMRLLPETRFELSMDACDDTVGAAEVVPGDNLIPQNDSYSLTYSAKDTAVTAKNYLKVDAVKYFRLGGQFGNEFAKTMVVRAKHTDAIA